MNKSIILLTVLSIGQPNAWAQFRPPFLVDEATEDFETNEEETASEENEEPSKPRIPYLGEDKVERIAELSWKPYASSYLPFGQGKGVRSSVEIGLKQKREAAGRLKDPKERAKAYQKAREEIEVKIENELKALDPEIAARRRFYSLLDRFEMARMILLGRRDLMPEEMRTRFFNEKAQGWWGVCDQWSSATLNQDVNEILNKTRGVVIGNRGQFLFSQGDLEELFTMLYTIKAVIDGPGSRMKHKVPYTNNLYRDAKSATGSDDMEPHKLEKYAFDRLGNNQGFIMELSSNDQIWNHPVFKIEVKSNELMIDPDEEKAWAPDKYLQKIPTKYLNLAQAEAWPENSPFTRNEVKNTIIPTLDRFVETMVTASSQFASEGPSQYEIQQYLNKMAKERKPPEYLELPEALKRNQNGVRYPFLSQMESLANVVLRHAQANYPESWAKVSTAEAAKLGFNPKWEWSRLEKIIFKVWRYTEVEESAKIANVHDFAVDTWSYVKVMLIKDRHLTLKPGIMLDLTKARFHYVTESSYSNPTSESNYLKRDYEYIVVRHRATQRALGSAWVTDWSSRPDFAWKPWSRNIHDPDDQREHDLNGRYLNDLVQMISRGEDLKGLLDGMEQLQTWGKEKKFMLGGLVEALANIGKTSDSVADAEYIGGVLTKLFVRKSLDSTYRFFKLKPRKKGSKKLIKPTENTPAPTEEAPASSEGTPANGETTPLASENGRSDADPHTIEASN